ncbi:MAG: hypothetical protein IT550_08075 [Novosphingobium sp.]|nr:hypothetical protein [Novosphingobium sp.]
MAFSAATVDGLEGLLQWCIAPLERRIGSVATARLWAVADQGASGVANVLVFALFGRGLTPHDFGSIGMMMGLYYFIGGFHRSAIVLPFTTWHRTDADAIDVHRDDSNWWWLGLGLALLVSAGTGIAALVVRLAGAYVPDVQWLVEPLYLTALVTPALLAWEFARRWLYKIERPQLVAACSGLYLVVLVAGALLAGRYAPDSFAAAMVWVLASIVALVVALMRLVPMAFDRAAAALITRENKAHAAWLAATNLPYSIYSTASIVVWIGLFMGPLEAAVFTAARTLTNPAISVVSAIDSIDKPRAARALVREGIPGLRRIVRNSRISIAVATGLYLGGVAILATYLTHLAYGGQYTGLEEEVRWLALGFFLFSLNLPSETMLIVLRAGPVMLTVRCITAAITLAALAFSARHGVAGMAGGFAASQFINCLLLIGAERVALARWSRSR